MNRTELETALYPYYDAETDRIDIPALCAHLGEDPLKAAFAPVGNHQHEEIIRVAQRHNRLAAVPNPTRWKSWLRGVLFALLFALGMAATFAPVVALVAV